MVYSRRVERSGGCGGSRISPRNRKEDRKRKIFFPDFPEDLLERESSSREEYPREEPFLPSGEITSGEAREIMLSLREFGEDPRALLEIYTPFSFEKENTSGRWVDARG